jgi:hypothetical protein
MASEQKYWRFKEFVGIGDDIGAFESWLNGLPLRDQAKIEAFIRRLELIEHWPPNLVFPLTGYRKIYELKIRGRIQYRPLGCYGPEHDEFTLLVGAEERDDKFEPKNAPAIATERQKLIQNPRFTRYLWTNVKEE